MSLADFQQIAPTPVDAELRKSNAGRKPKLLPTDAIIRQIGELAGLQCTHAEAGAVLGVCDETFSKFLGAHEKAAEAWERGKDEGKASLRRLQYDSAKKGNVTAQIWLGKQWLNQKDKIENELTGKDGAPIQYGSIQIIGVNPDGSYWDVDNGRKANIQDREKPAIEHVPVAAGDGRNGGRS